jgi:hypothetical protein
MIEVMKLVTVSDNDNRFALYEATEPTSAQLPG